MASITLHEVRKSYGRNEVIHGVDMAIEDGEFVVIVGPSGCGKSTLLRMVAGLETITSGTIAIGDRVVNDIEPAKRDIAMVFQNYALYPHMTVYRNMAYGLRIAGLPKAQIDERVARAARMLQLEGLLERKPGQLSGGQRQRVAMGRALVREPAAFLLDEPLSNLDAKLRVQMRLEIRAMQRAVATTALYVTHDQVEAMTLADRLVVMNEGVAEQIDTPLAVYGEPASTFVAAFIGSPPMNLLACRVAEDGRGLLLDERVRLPGFGLPAGEASAIFGVRPEHLVAVPPSEADLSIRVLALETLGADILAHGRLDEPAQAPGARAPAGIEAGNVVARLPASARLQVGELLPLRIDRDAVHFFAAQGGRRLAA